MTSSTFFPFHCIIASLNRLCFSSEDQRSFAEHLSRTLWRKHRSKTAQNTSQPHSQSQLRRPRYPNRVGTGSQSHRHAVGVKAHTWTKFRPTRQDKYCRKFYDFCALFGSKTEEDDRNRYWQKDGGRQQKSVELKIRIGPGVRLVRHS